MSKLLWYALAGVVAGLIAENTSLRVKNAADKKLYKAKTKLKKLVPGT